MHFDLRYPFSQILTKPALSGTSLVRVEREYEVKQSVGVSYILQMVDYSQ